MTHIVALTGGIGTGKSSVARLFEKLGARVLDADAIVRELQAPGSPVLAAIVDAFGEGILTEDGALDREALGAIAFQDKQARRRLESLVHPAVGAEMARRLAAARAEGVPVVVLDIPLLFEGRRAGRGGASQGSFETTVLVYAPEATQVERVVARDGCTREEALRRIRAQIPIEEKRALADHVIDNTGRPEDTERQVRALWQRLGDGS